MPRSGDCSGRMIGGMTDAVLVASGVHKQYGSTLALRGVDLTVNRGELFGLLGPNGAGKTTFMSILAGLAEPSAGSVTLFGVGSGSRDRDLRRKIGIATQELAVYPELTARENLEFFGRMYGLRGTPLRDRVAEMLAAVELTDRADHRAGTFSGGMKRRLNLAVAVVHGPELLLLDEPTTGVDPQSRNHIFERVRALNAAGMSIVYTSHYMEEVQTLCPRIAVLDGGKVLACDTLGNLLKLRPAKLRVRFAGGDGWAERLAAIPGVNAVSPTADGFDLCVDDLPTACARVAISAGDALVALDPDPPTLERVFLHLTGKALRD